MEDDPEDITDDLMSGGALLAINLRAGVLDSATPTQINAIMRQQAKMAEELARAYRGEVHRRRALEEEARTGIYLQGADWMAKALVRAEHNAKQSRHWLEAANIERRANEARKAYDKALYVKLALAAGFAAGLVVLALYALRRATFYSLAGSLLLWGAVGLLVMTVVAWIDLSRRQKAALKEANHWFNVSAAETRKAEELRARREAEWAKMRADAGDDEGDDDL